MREYWDTHPYGSSKLDWPQDVFLNLLAPAVRGKRVLELGCGSGGLSARLADLAPHVTAVDFSEAMLREARTRYGHVANLTFVHSDLLELDLGLQFDVLCGVMVLHEIPITSYSRLIAVLKKHMAPDSFGFFQENSFFNPAFQIFRKRVVGRYGVPKMGSDDERPFDRSRMAAICNGFRYCDRSGEAFVLFQMVHDYVIRSRRIRPVFVYLDQTITASPIPDSIRRNFTYCQGVFFSDYGARSAFLSPHRAAGRPRHG